MFARCCWLRVLRLIVLSSSGHFPCEPVSAQVAWVAMRAYRWPLVLLVALFVFTPFAVASAYESWTDGIYDHETDDLLQAAKCPEAAIDCAPFVAARCAPAVTSLAFVGHDSAAPAIVAPARPGRAPPAS